MAKYKHEIFKKAYPEHILDITETQIIWRDGTAMPVNVTESKLVVPLSKIEQRNYQEKLNDPVILDQISITYIPGQEGIKQAATVVNYDPGRIRYMPFFKKMYGTSQEEVKNNLVEVKWLPNVLKSKSDDVPIKLPVTSINNVADKVASISSRLEDVLSDDQIKKYLDNPGGTFCWREIAGTNRLSGHSFGMTVDINASESSYWLWDYKKEYNISSKVNIKEEDVDANSFPSYRNTIPETIIQAFFEEGFICGGHWYHYDTMHFEYRPELLADLIGENT